MMRRYIDIGANLTDTMYLGIYNGSKKHDPDLQQVLKRSWDAGLSRIIITGGNFNESKKGLELAETDDRLFVTVGCHPTRCSEFEKDGENPDEYLAKLKELVLGNNKVVAIGECGLDYDRIQFCPKEVQKKYFEYQLQLNETTRKPLFLHCRNAAIDLNVILDKYPDQKGVVHSFDGSTEEAKLFLDRGLYLGINGCSLKNQSNLETVKMLPLDRILIETDCPWCEIRPTHAGYKFIKKENQLSSVKKEKWTPENIVKSRNEPCNIRQILDIVSAIKNEDPDKLSERLYQNTIDLFWTIKKNL